MTKRIDTQARIEAVRFEDQGSPPASPTAGYSLVFTKSDGLYIETSAGAVIGPLITGSMNGFWGEVLLDSTATGGGSANFDLNSIAAGFKKIEILLNVRSTTTTSASVNIEFNGDTTVTNYEEVTHLSGTDHSATWVNDNRIGYIVPSDQGANRFSLNRILLFDYDATDKYKTAIAESNYQYTTTAGYHRIISSLWKSTSAITRITIVPGAGNFAAGSRCLIVGYKTY